MSIVKKFSDQFKQISILTGIKPVALNKTDPKYIPYHNRYASDFSYTKGVDSDHIKIFKLDAKTSFGIAFYYDQIAAPMIRVTIKKEDDHNWASAQFSEPAFKEKMKQFVKLLKILNDAKMITAATVESTVLANFIKDHEVSDDDSVQGTMKLINQEVAQLKAKYQKRIEENKQLEQDLVHKKSQITKAVDKIKAKHNLSELQTKWDAAWAEIHKTEEKESSKLKISELETKVRHSSWALIEYHREVEKVVEQHSATLPKHLKLKVKELTNLKK